MRYPVPTSSWKTNKTKTACQRKECPLMRIDKGFDPIAAVAPNVCSTNDQKAIWKAGRCLRPRGEWPFSIFTYRHLSNDITIFHGNCHRRAILFYVPSLLQIKPYGLKSICYSVSLAIEFLLLEVKISCLDFWSTLINHCILWIEIMLVRPKLGIL